MGNARKQPSVRSAWQVVDSAHSLVPLGADRSDILGFQPPSGRSIEGHAVGLEEAIENGSG